MNEKRQLRLDSNNSYSDYQHIHVIPKENEDLLKNITSPSLNGKTITDAWKNTLKDPNKYLSISPNELVSPCYKVLDSKSFLSYLEKRYW
uniref:PGN_0703 family putative restriction endonuclease n=1 Tax=Proteinivorax hydrogeniformans TaxID=1826727 RepID=UPI003EBFBB34